jgi:hypothetical protein
MNSILSRCSIRIRPENLKYLVGIAMLFLLPLTACSPATAMPTSVELQTVSPEVAPTTVVEATTIPTAVPIAAPTEGLAYPFYLQGAQKLDDVSQTIDGVTAQIDWAYVDEGRVAIQYTISGLDWPDGSMLDLMQQVRMSVPEISTFRLGGFSGAEGANVSTTKQGVITGSSDKLLLDGALDAEKHPNITVDVEIPVEGPTKIGTFHFRFTTPVGDGIKIENIDQTLVANNVSMTLKTLILNPSHAEALICFQMPSPLDWGLTASTITVGGTEYPFSGGGLASGKADPDSALTSPERCNDVRFNIAYEMDMLSSVTLTVPKLMASVSEVVTEDTVNKANQRLAGTGIVFNYENIDHGGNIVILQRPDGMSDEEVYPLIWDALAEQYEGPWVFTVQIPK